ncbi:MAG: hypothetical protein CME82_04115 [Halomonas sp.]|nr:hypothetical protein [Halomonas sp.]|tara:strand:- start:9301 stop:12120 length:2820 start_codon:yes stop_codon:yes gene_type:complete
MSGTRTSVVFKHACTWLAALVTSLLGLTAQADTQPSVAFYYEASPPVELLDQFDWVVVDADAVTEREHRGLAARGAEVFAYLSVGEWDADRPTDAQAPQAALVGSNPDWDTRIADLSDDDWRNHLLDQRVEVLVDAGYDGLFLDTLDSYRRFAPDGPAAQAQQLALVSLIDEIHRRHPDLKLLLNRGFEVLDQVHDKIAGVAAESLFRGWTPATDVYGGVTSSRQQWLQQQFERVRGYGLPAIAIDYVPAENRELARQTARRILDAGVIPWVTTPGLDQIGVGLIEPIPRRLLIFYDADTAENGDISNLDAFRYLAPILDYLGYSAEYRDIATPPPPGTMHGRYAAILSWFPSPPARDTTALSTWLSAQVSSGVRLILMGDQGIDLSQGLGRQLGIINVESVESSSLKARQHDALVGFEGMPEGPGIYPAGYRLLADTNTAHLTLADRNGVELSPVVTGPWGGVALSPWLFQEASDSQQRWILDPFAFIAKSLGMGDFPVPDATTENGSRLWLTHIDGDAFISRGEWPGAPFTGEVMLDQILKRYQVPTTVSIIEGEFGEGGTHPELRTQLEPLAREIFALPWVEIATHTYSHPFDWLDLKEGDLAGQGRTPAGFPFNMPLDGYHFSLEREVAGSTAYINRDLAPPGKRVTTILWSGDAVPPEKALAISERLGLTNLNGGNTHITRDNPSLTQVSPMLRPIGHYLQVLAPEINENVYTGHMTTPKWGYRRVLETFELTDLPRRLKPINIYYHFYSAAYPASLRALEEVYDAVTELDTLPLYASTYSDIATHWYDLGVARRLDGAWQITGGSSLRTLRLPESLGWPDLRRSTGVVSVTDIKQGRYLSLDGQQRQILWLGQASPRLPHLRRANGRTTAWHRGTDGGFSLTLEAEQVALEAELAGLGQCHVKAPGARQRRQGDSLVIDYSGPGPATIEVSCG